MNLYDDEDETESCESIPEEYTDQVTFNNSPINSNSEGSQLVKSSNHTSRRETKTIRDSDYGTREEIYQKLRNNSHHTNASNQDTVKKMYPNVDSNLAVEKDGNRATEPSYKKQHENCTTLTDRERKSKLSLGTYTSASNRKLYRAGDHRSVTHFTPNKQTSEKKSVKNKSKNHSFILPGNSNIGVKKENQIYGKSLEEFIESNIKWIGDLIEYKQQVNHDIIKYNTKDKHMKSELDFELKRQNQIKSETQNVIAGKLFHFLTKIH